MKKLLVLEKDVLRNIIHDREETSLYVSNVLNHYLPDGHCLVVGDLGLHYETGNSYRKNNNTKICNLSTRVTDRTSASDETFFIVYNTIRTKFNDIRLNTISNKNSGRNNPDRLVGLKFSLFEDSTFTYNAIHNLLKIITIFNNKRIQNQETVEFLSNRLTFIHDDERSKLSLYSKGIAINKFTIQIKMKTEIAGVNKLSIDIYPSTTTIGFNNILIEFYDTYNHIKIYNISAENIYNLISSFDSLNDNIEDRYTNGFYEDNNEWYYEFIKEICIEVCPPTTKIEDFDSSIFSMFF